MQIYSVSEFVKGINELLVSIPVAIQGEVSNFKISQNRFVWFDLKDDSSYVSCFMLKFQLDQELEDGMEIQVFGNPGLFKKSGRFHVRVNKIELVGEGTLKRQYELLKAKLQKEGLFDEDRKRTLPKFPARIGIVTSEGAAAFTDVQRILADRWAGLDIKHFNVQVQGNAAPNTIIDALNFINHYYADKLDVVIITRGGGSIEDLHAFNDEGVVRAIFALQVPCIVGVGHERDETLSEYVSDVRAATPSNAAELAVPFKEDVLYQIKSLINSQERSLRDVVARQHENVVTAVDVLDEQVIEFSNKVKNAQQAFILGATKWEHVVNFNSAKVDYIMQLLASYNPKKILERGYTITKTSTNKVVTSKKIVKKKSTITTVFKDGEIKSEVL
ncbi:MAG: exodeoxyribonuclease VII large subunit [bacterium]|nr:exodeoxyribonuclease VII large subunit [bacterium]